MDNKCSHFFIIYKEIVCKEIMLKLYVNLCAKFSNIHMNKKKIKSSACIETSIENHYQVE